MASVKGQRDRWCQVFLHRYVLQHPSQKRKIISDDPYSGWSLLERFPELIKLEAALSETACCVDEANSCESEKLGMNPLHGPPEHLLPVAIEIGSMTMSIGKWGR